MRRPEKKSAFTLVELLVVVAIIGVLIGTLLPAMRKARERSQFVQCLSNLRQIGLGTSNYLTDNRFFFPIIETYAISYTQMAWLGKAGTGGYLNWNASQRYLNRYLGGPYSPTAEMPVARCPTDAAFGMSNSFYNACGASYAANAAYAPGYPTTTHTLALTTTRSVSLSAVASPARMVAISEFGAFDPIWSSVDDGPAFRWHDRESQTFNMTFVDGHAAAINVVTGVPFNDNYSFYREY